MKSWITATRRQRIGVRVTESNIHNTGHKPYGETDCIVSHNTANKPTRWGLVEYNVQVIRPTSVVDYFSWLSGIPLNAPACFRRIMELSFPCTFAPGSESSIGGTSAPGAPWNFNSLERKWCGTFDPMTKSKVELSLPTRIISDLYRLCMLWWFQLLQFLLRIASLGGIKRVGLQASTGHGQGMTSCDPCSPCVQLVATTIFGQRERKFHGTKIPPIELSLPGVKVRGNKSTSYPLIDTRQC